MKHKSLSRCLLHSQWLRTLTLNKVWLHYNQIAISRVLKSFLSNALVITTNGSKFHLPCSCSLITLSFPSTTLPLCVQRPSCRLPFHLCNHFKEPTLPCFLCFSTSARSGSCPLPNGGRFQCSVLVCCCKGNHYLITL